MDDRGERVPRKRWLEKSDYEEYRRMILPPNCYILLDTKPSPLNPTSVAIEVCTYEGFGLSDIKSGEANFLIAVSEHDPETKKSRFLHIITPY
jgi:hypothetical protein